MNMNKRGYFAIFFLFRKLAVIKSMIKAVFGEELGMISLLDDLTVTHDEDHVGGFDG